MELRIRIAVIFFVSSCRTVIFIYYFFFLGVETLWMLLNLTFLATIYFFFGK